MDWVLLLGGPIGLLVLEALSESIIAFVRWLFPSFAEWWDRGGRVTVRLWVLILGGLLVAAALLVLGVDRLPSSSNALWLVALAAIPGLVAFVAAVALLRHSAFGRGYSRSGDGSWSAGS